MSGRCSINHTQQGLKVSYGCKWIEHLSSNQALLELRLGSGEGSHGGNLSSHSLSQQGAGYPEPLTWAATYAAHPVSAAMPPWSANGTAKSRV